MSLLSVREDICDRQNAYTDFYRRFVEHRFSPDRDFLNNVQNVLDSGNVLPGAFENGDDLEIHQCAYVLQFGVRDACLAEETFRKSAMECKKLGNLCSKERINICCLGSQSLFAVLGICKVIEEHAREFRSSSPDRTQVQVLVIDSNATWSYLSECIVDAAKEAYPALKLKLDFFTKDVTKKLSKQVSMRIELSHIVAMVRCLSNLTSGKTAAKLTENTSNKMKKNAVLFYLDHDTRDDLGEMAKLIAESKSFTEINRSKSPKKYVLHEEARRYHQSSYKYLSPLDNTVQWDKNSPPVTFSTWIKNPEVKLKRLEEVIRVCPRQPEVRLGPEDPDKFYRPKHSSNVKRNSTEKFKLVGKFAYMDMEKRNKDDTNRQTAKEASTSRFADFDGW